MLKVENNELEYRIKIANKNNEYGYSPRNFV